MNTFTLSDLESLRSYFGFNGFHYFERSEFNTAINQFENEMYLTMRSAFMIENSLKAHQDASKLSKTLREATQTYDDLIESDQEKQFTEYIQKLETSVNIFNTHLGYLHRGGKKTLPNIVRYWMIKAIEASKKEFNSYEPFRIYMLEALKNYFFIMEKNRYVILDDLIPENLTLPAYFYIYTIPSIKPDNNQWIRALKQTLKIDLNMEVTSYLMLHSQSERRYKRYCRENNVNYDIPYDLQCFNYLFNRVWVKKDSNQLELFSRNEEDLRTMINAARPIYEEAKKYQAQQKALMSQTYTPA